MLALTQVTPCSELNWLELVLGLLTMVQPLPVSRSISVWKALPLLNSPTAQQLLVLTQVTPYSKLYGLELVLLEMGFGLEPGAGVAAFQRSLAETVAVPQGVA